MPKKGQNKEDSKELNPKIKFYKEFITGSRCFFSQYPEFLATNPDEDKLVLWSGPDSHSVYFKDGSWHEIFRCHKRDKIQLINDVMTSEVASKIIRFLTPDFNKEVGFTIEDLSQFQPLIDKLDEKHLYAKIIFESYLKNNDFVLTDEQRLAAYSEYKKARKL